MNTYIYIFLNIWFIVLIAMCLTTCFDIIGDMNVAIENGNLERRKKYRRKDISNFKLYVPIARKFTKPVMLFGQSYKPPFDGTVVLPTFIFTIISYIIHLISIILLLIAAIFYSKILLGIAISCALGYLFCLIIVTKIISKQSN